MDVDAVSAVGVVAVDVAVVDVDDAPTIFSFIGGIGQTD